MRPDLRAIVVTGHDDFELVREALRLEAIDYLLKPATRDELRASLLRAIREIDEIRETSAALDEHRWSYFHSLIDATWPWFAEGVDITPAAVRRLDEGLRERIGFEAAMLVAFESPAEDAGALGRALLERVSPASGECDLAASGRRHGNHRRRRSGHDGEAHRYRRRACPRGPRAARPPSLLRGSPVLASIRCPR